MLKYRIALQWGFKFEKMYPGFDPSKEDLSDSSKASTKIYKAAKYIEDDFWIGFLLMMKRLNVVLINVEG